MSLKGALKILKQRPEELKLGMLIFFVTSRCNAKCRTCFYWEELNKRGDMTFEQIEKVSRTAPSFTDLWLSGGEPTLRPDLTEIIHLFVKNNGVSRINFPTNGLQTERTVSILRAALERHPALSIYCNLSLDGLQRTHESIRGVPGNFERLLETARKLCEVRARFGARLRVNVNTVVCEENHGEVLQLAEFLKEHAELDGQYFQIVRGETMDKSLKQVPAEELRKIYKGAVKSYEYYSKRVAADANPISRWVQRALYIGALTFHNRVQLDSYRERRGWPMRCSAGITSAVLDYNGTVRACELRSPIAHLKDYDYDFGALWADQLRQQEIAAIEQAKCSKWCTHVCFLHDSLRHSRRAIFYEIPKNYLTRHRW